MNILRYALKNIFRNLFLSISSVLIISLLVFFVNILLFVLFSTEQFISSVSDRLSITISFREGFGETDPRTVNLMNQISSAFTGISLTYLSRESALTVLSLRDPELASLVETAADNPLPNSLKISGIQPNAYQSLNNYIARFQDVLKYTQDERDKKLLDYKAQYSRILTVVNFLKSLEYGVYILLGLFIFTVFAIVHMIIRNFIYFLQNEVEIIELVGGSSYFVYGPFVIQGIFYTFFATLIALSVFYLGRNVISAEYVSKQIIDLFNDFFTYLQYWAPWQILCFTSIGAISSLLASRRYIHSTIG